MATRVKVTYIGMDNDGNKPIVSASTFEDLKAGLDDYYGCDGRGGECLGFTPYQTKYPDEYEGYYQYRVKMVHSGRDEKFTEYIDTVKVYCVDYYPHTVYEIKEDEQENKLNNNVCPDCKSYDWSYYISIDKMKCGDCGFAS